MIITPIIMFVPENLSAATVNSMSFFTVVKLQPEGGIKNNQNIDSSVFIPPSNHFSFTSVKLGTTSGGNYRLL